MVTLYPARFRPDSVVGDLLYVMAHEIIHHVHPDWEEDVVERLALDLASKRAFVDAALRVAVAVLVSWVVSPHGIYSVK